MIGQTFTISERHTFRTLRPVEEKIIDGILHYLVEDSAHPEGLTQYVANAFKTRFEPRGKKKLMKDKKYKFKKSKKKS